MKKIVSLLALFAMLMLWGTQVQAKTVVVTAAGGIAAAINDASFAKGDTIYLDRGVTYTAGVVNAKKGFTLMANPSTTGANPLISTGADGVTCDAVGTFTGGSIVIQNVDFACSVDKYFINIRAALTVDSIVVRGCKVTGFSGSRLENSLMVPSILIDNSIFIGAGEKRVGYAILQLSGTSGAVNIKLKNSTFYKNYSNVYTGSAANTLTVENCTFFQNNGSNLPSLPANKGLFSNSNADFNAIFRNCIIRDMFLSTGSVAGDLNFNASSKTYNYNSMWSNYTISTTPWATKTPSPWTTNSNPIDDDGNWDFADPANGDFTITGTSAASLRTGGQGGACVGDPRSYPGYTPPVPADLVWDGADNALWNVASNWNPDALPGALGSATIESGIAQSSGGKFDTKVILATGGTLKLASAPDTITTLQLRGGTLVGSNTLVSGVSTFAKSSISVPAAGTLTIPMEIAGTDTLVKVGSGTLNLTASASVFAGTWRIEAGAVKVTGAGAALGTEMKVDFCGGTLELDGEVVSLLGYYTQNGVALAVGTYTATSHPALISGTGTLKVTASRVFTFVSQSRVAWNSKAYWYPLRDLVAGDTALVKGSYPSGESTKPYDISLEPSPFPAGAKLFIQDGARARLIISAAAGGASFAADIESQKAIFYTSTSGNNIFGLDGTLLVKDTTYFKGGNTGVLTDTITLLKNKRSPISIGATLSGSAPIVVAADDPAKATEVYGVQMIKANNTAYTGNFIVENTNLVGKAVACFGRSNTIYLANGTSLHLEVADATDKTQTINAATGAKIYLEQGTTRLTKLVLGGTEYTEGDISATSNPNFISGAGVIKLGMVPVSSVVISTPDSVQAAVAGATMQLSAVAYPLNADDRDITWSIVSGDASIVDATGLVTFGAAGSVTVKAQTLNGTSVTKVIQVLAAAQLMTSLSISGPSSMEMGEAVIYTATYQPANATDNKMVWDIIAGSADTVHLSNNRLQVISKTTDPLTVKVWAASATGVTATKNTSIIRATSYNWVVNESGLWRLPMYWDPQVVPVAGDSAYIIGNTPTSRFMLGLSGEDDPENFARANFDAKLFLMDNTHVRLALVDDKTGNLNPFTSGWDAIESKWRMNAPVQMKGGYIEIISGSPKTWVLDGELNMIDSSFIYTSGGSSDLQALYLYSEVKGSAPLVLTGDNSRLSNNPNEPTGGALAYAQATVIVRRANPNYTGKWRLHLMNLHTKEARGFGKADIHVGTGRKLFVDHEKAVDSLATIYVESGGMISTKLNGNITIAVKRLVLNGVVQPDGYYSRNMQSVRDYFENDKVIVKVGDVSLVPVTSISISGPGSVAVGADAQYTALVLPSNSEQTVTWTVNPADMGTINASGLFTSGITAGQVTITATATDRSGVVGTKRVNIMATTAVASEELGSLLLSPNPVQSELRIEGEKMISEIRIYTLSAALMQVAPVNGYAATVDMSGYAAGSYLVVVSYIGTDKKLSKLVVKQ